jgi:putative ABC transport system permease protein
MPPREVGYVVRTVVAPTAMGTQLRAAIASIDREVPLADIRTLEERSSLTLAPQTTTMHVATLFAATAMLLSAIGLYGVLTYLVSQRTREIGVRVAIGSTPSAIIAMVMREGLVLAAVGICVGAIGTVVLRPILATQLSAPGSLNPLLVVATALALGLIALIACVFPARRAAGVDAMSVLQSQ